MGLYLYLKNQVIFYNTNSDIGLLSNARARIERVASNDQISKPNEFYHAHGKYTGHNVKWPVGDTGTRGRAGYRCPIQ